MQLSVALCDFAQLKLPHMSHLNTPHLSVVYGCGRQAAACAACCICPFPYTHCVHTYAQLSDNMYVQGCGLGAIRRCLHGQHDAVC